jgi:uncharacterized membrane protein
MNTTKITINSHEVVLKFGMRCAKYIESKLSTKYFFDGEDITEIGMAHVIYGGHLNYCAVKDEPEVVTFEQIVDFIESNLTNKDVVQEIANAIKLWMEVQMKMTGDVDAKKKTSKK